MFSQDGRIFNVAPQFIETPESSEFVTLYRNSVDGKYYFRLSTGADVPVDSFIGGIAGGELSGTYPNPSLVNNAVIGKILTGLIIGGGSVVATDSIVVSIGKLQGQINMLLGGVMYQGTWNALTNNPVLVSSVGTKGYYYVVNVTGNTNLNGITDWRVGDWAIFNGVAWEKVDNTDQKTIQDLVNNPELFDDFIGRSVNWTPQAIGAGSSLNYNNALSGHPGNAYNKSYWSLNTTGANNTGGALVLSQSSSPSNQSQVIFLGQSTIKLEASYLMRVAGGIPFGVNGFASIFGLLNNNTGGTITNGIYVIGDIQTINPNYVFRCTSGGITTSVVTSVPILNMVERRMRIEINSTGTQAQLFINDVLEATIATNIPSGVTLLIGTIICRRSNAAGGLACSTYIDWISFKETFNVSKI